MIQILPNLYIGDQNDCEGFEGAILHACKEPYHRQFVGYTGRALAKDHPEYLYAVRDNELALNIVDVDDPKYFAEEMINKALQFIGEHDKVLLHCNQGQSRSAGIGMLYMRTKGLLDGTFEEAEEKFKEIYPPYSPRNGIREYVRLHW